MTGPGWPKLELLAPDGTTVTSDNNPQAVQLDVTLSTTGVYTLIVSDNTGNTGNYTLVWQRVDRPCGTSPLDCGQQVTGSISTGPELDWYSLQFSAGDVIRIRMTGPNWPGLELLAPNGTTVASDNNPQAVQLDVTLSTSGVYTLMAHDNTRNPGDYTLVWQRLNRPCGASPLDCGQQVTGSISTGPELDWYSLQFSAGDVIRIRMTGPNWPGLDFRQ